jgi:hypothetical protein
VTVQEIVAANRYTEHDLLDARDERVPQAL